MFVRLWPVSWYWGQNILSALSRYPLQSMSALDRFYWIPAERKFWKWFCLKYAVADFMSPGGHCRLVALKSSKVFVAGESLYCAQKIPLSYHSRKLIPTKFKFYLWRLLCFYVRNFLPQNHLPQIRKKNRATSVRGMSYLFLLPQTVSAHPRNGHLLVLEHCETNKLLTSSGIIVR